MFIEDDVETPEEIGKPSKEELKNYYVSNKLLYQTYIDWYAEIETAKKNNLPEPEIPPYITEAIVKITKRLATRFNFVNYSFKDEMIGDALIKNIRKVKNFDVTKGNNPFGFIGQISWRAFINRITLEKRESNIKGSLINELSIEELFDMSDSSEESINVQQQYVDFLRDNNCFVSEEIIKVKQVFDEKTLFDGLFEEKPND